MPQTTPVKTKPGTAMVKLLRQPAANEKLAAQARAILSVLHQLQSTPPRKAVPRLELVRALGTSTALATKQHAGRVLSFYRDILQHLGYAEFFSMSRTEVAEESSVSGD